MFIPVLIISAGKATKFPNGNFLKPFTKSDRKSTRLNSSHGYISYAVFCLKKKNKEKKKRKKKKKKKTIQLAKYITRPLRNKEARTHQVPTSAT